MNRAFNRMRGVVGLSAVALMLVASVPARAQSTADGKFNAAVREAVLAGQSVRAIVRFTDDAARVRGASTVTLRGGRVHRTHQDIVGLNVVVDATTAALLADDAGVASISLDAEVRSSASSTLSGRSSGAARARQQYNRAGRGLAVAVVDSGVQPHVDLPSSRIRAFVDFVNGRTVPYDDFGHGTHVAGILAGSGAASSSLESPVTGAAPAVDVVALKVLNSQGAGRTSDVIAALEWVAANHQTYNIRVVNLSLGHPVFESAETDPLVQAADALVRRGIVVVVSAGNQGVDPRDGEVGYGGITSPAHGPSLIAVGAVDTKGTDLRSDDRVTDYSSRGPTRFDLIVKPDLVAPGHQVVSLAAPGSYLYQNYPALRVSAGGETTPSYLTLSGTSMAAPAVAGAAALMVEANPRLSAGAVRAVLAFTAQHLPDTDLMTQGGGYLNALGAVRLAGVLKAQAPLGTVWLRAQKSVPVAYDQLSGETVTWSKNIIWGQRVIVGDSAYIHLAAWDDNIIWGQDDNIIWGQDDNIIWGQSQLEPIGWGECATAECLDVVWGQDDDNIIWGQDNIIWGQDNIIWGQDSGVLGYWADNTVWGFWSDLVAWNSVTEENAQNIIWGQDYLDNIIWGQDNIIWGQDNIIWGQNLTVLTGGGR